jgi:dihydroxyacid dehydratase/phosphogluconate dehydratase
MTSSNDLAAGSQLRTDQWCAGDDRNAYIRRAWMRRWVPGDAFTGRPQIAIANTASDLTPCNAPFDRGCCVGEGSRVLTRGRCPARPQC